MHIRREATRKLRGFSCTQSNASQISSLNNSMDKIDLENIQKQTQDNEEFLENDQAFQPQKTQTARRFYQELEVNIANDEEKILELLRKLLKMDPIKRTFRECMSIYKLLRTTGFMTDVVTNIGFKIAVRLCKHLVYESFEDKQFIYKEGQISDKVYILLSGKLGVIIKNKEQKDVLIGEVNKFEDFGKIEVQNNISRNSTMIAQKRCEVCSIDKRTYIDVIGQIKKKSSDYFLDNFRLFNCFSHLSKSKQLSLIPIINVRYFTRNQFVYKEKEQAKHIYFIISGDFKAYSSMVVATNDYQGEYVVCTQHLTSETENLFRIRHSVRKIQLAIYTAGEIVGSEDLLSDDEIRSSELVCDSERGIIFAISRQDLEARIAEDDPFWQNLLDIALVKIENKERKLESLRDPKRKTGINKEVILSQKRIRISAEKKMNPIINQNQMQKSINHQHNNYLNHIEIHVNKINNASQERLNQPEQQLYQDRIEVSKSSLSSGSQKPSKNDENPLRNSALLSSSEPYSAQQLDEIVSKNNSFVTQFLNPGLIRPLNEKKTIYSHRNSYLSNHTSSTHETTGDFQDTTGSKGKSDASSRQNYQMNTEFSNILPPKKFIVTKRKERVLSQESMKTQESFCQQKTATQPMTHRAGTSRVVRRETLNRSMENLEVLKSSIDNEFKDGELEEIDNIQTGQIINKHLGGSDKSECYREVMQNLRKKNINIQETKEFSDIHMNYNYLRSSRIDRNSVKLHRISQKLLQDQNVLNTSQNEIEQQKQSQVTIKQISNNTYKATYSSIIPNTFFTSFKLNQHNNQNNKINFIQNPKALKSSYHQLQTVKDSLNASQRNLSIEKNNNNNTNNYVSQNNTQLNKSSQNCLTNVSDGIPEQNLFTFENNRYKSIRIKKKNVSNVLNQSIL